MKIVEFETAVKLKEVGFIQEGRGYYQIHSSEDFGQLKQSKEPEFHNEVDYPWKTYQAPYQYEVIDWLREVHKIDLSVIRQPEYEYKDYYCVSVSNFNTGYRYESPIALIWVTDNITIGVGEKYTYVEALEKGLQEALKLIT